ncbi:phosphatase PAP2 family protein [Noviherbaspirillum sedimenti]|uniref:Phosphatase PAP2 family protein n=2 Tax=Noviherbaspirillum sedimenti TaxID=2320865 RepID=A0A3A3G297_9BURK|nr:phosphatase PAP2 family protein [Noviherbaspirillum sedimenti]
MKCAWCGYLVVGGAQAFAAPALNGQTGYINMPSAAVAADGSFSLGYSYDSPYGALWVTSTFLPFLEVTGRYVSITGIPGFSNDPNAFGGKYGRYKDKVIDTKLQLLEESGWRPAFALGITDVFGTGLFKGQYAVASKTFGVNRNLEASIGYGNQRPDGVFAGVRWQPQSLPNWALVAEYDANDYPKDFRAAATSAGQREKGPSVGVEYRWGWLGVQAARHRDHSSLNAYVSIPFGAREFIPKVYEPPYYQPKHARPRPTLEQWRNDPAHGAAMIDVLGKQDYKNIRVELKGHTLHLALTNSRISNLGRAVGRATRIALAFAPAELRSIHVTYTRLEQPVATYEFFDLDKLADYLDGRIPRQAFLENVLLRYPNPDDMLQADREGVLVGVKDNTGLEVRTVHEGESIQLISEDREANRFKLAPKLGFFFNDPSGALRYEVAAAANYNKRLGNGLYLSGAMGLKLIENVSDVKQPSNSLLPHVRTDVAEYKRGNRLKLHRLLVNQYMMPAERWYARVSGGLYEEMYRGVGAQVLYLPKDSRWAVDLTVDALQQRDFQGWFGKNSYQTMTALGALHYRLPYDMTATARAGRFLAKDEGVRMELKRRFQSGIEVGFWYTRTNGRDITSPGTPSSPYYDKGIFLSIPLRSMLPSDTQAGAGMAISPWTRDVGQMVASPGDLYDMVEDSRRDMNTFDGLGNFAERPDEQNLPAVNPPVQPLRDPWPAMRRRLENSSSALPSAPDLFKGVGLAAGALVVASVSDKKIDRFAKDHAGSNAIKGLDRFGKAMPVVMLGAAGLAAALGGERMQNTGLISLQSGAAAAGLSIAGKHMIGRARPMDEMGHWARAPKRSDSSLPSNHASVAFAAVTPFAKEYDAPWLYSVAAIGSMGRVAARKHWFSDAVVGGLLGYATGSWLWEAQRQGNKSYVSFNGGGGEYGVTWQTTY